MMKLITQQKLSTSVKLTPQLQQAIALLQLSQQELAQQIQQELDKNPLLERTLEHDEQDTNQTSLHNIDGDTQQESLLQQPLSHQSEQNLSELNSGETPHGLQQDLAMDMNWKDVYGSTASTVQSFTEQNFEQQTNQPVSLQQHLHKQMQLVKLSPTEQLICDVLIDSVDSNGLITTELHELTDVINSGLAAQSSQTITLDTSDIEVVLKLLQQCEPVGVGATSLAQSLDIQLQVRYPQHVDFACAQAILKHHTLLLKNKIAQLCAITKYDANQLKKGITLLRTLNPYPADAFDVQQDNTSSYEIPDVIIKKNVQGVWHAILNPDNKTNLSINAEYLDIAKNSTDTATKKYIQQHNQSARQFISALDERHKTLLAVSNAIANKQQDFFEHGMLSLKPMILQDIAEMVDMHISTISRVTTNKFCLTNHGLFELKYFFSTSIKSTNEYSADAVKTNTDSHPTHTSNNSAPHQTLSSEDSNSNGESNNCVSKEAIIAHIKNLILQEDPKKPLSDGKLEKMLAEQGIKVARRTIAKYRESVGIGSSSARKRLL